METRPGSPIQASHGHLDSTHLALGTAATVLVTTRGFTLGARITNGILRCFASRLEQGVIFGSLVVTVHGTSIPQKSAISREARSPL